MSKKVPIWLTVTLVLLAALIAFQTTFVILKTKYEGELRKVETSESGNVFNEKLTFIDSIFRNKYYGEIDEEMLENYLLKGYVLGTGDRYGAYYNKEEFEELTADDNASMQGIGVNVIYNADYGVVEVVNVMPDSPALEAGVQPGDLIIAVGEEGESVFDLGYDMALKKLRGEADTFAVFTVARGKDYSERVDFNIKRGYVTEQTVMHHVFEDDRTIGIIKILQFDAGTPEQFFSAIDELKGSGVEKYVFDVRYNPGGNLDSIVSILDFLLPAGPIIKTVDKAGNEQTLYSDKNEFDAPMAVLVNGSTASAAELFSSALKDYEKAALVGKTTYGKGSMQQIISLYDGSALRLTYKMYFPPFSEGYDGVGITPDIDVDMDESLANKNIYKITDNEDDQLQAAVKYLNEQ